MGYETACEEEKGREERRERGEEREGEGGGERGRGDRRRGGLYHKYVGHACQML